MMLNFWALTAECRKEVRWIIDELRQYLITAGLIAAVKGYPRIEGALFCIGVILA